MLRGATAPEQSCAGGSWRAVVTGSPHLSVVFEVGVCQSRDPPLGSGSAQGKGGRNHEEERGYCHIVGK